MTWNWEQAGWPAFAFDTKALEPFERQFLLRSGEFIGAFRHIGTADRAALRIELMSDEAVKTAAIEGEILNRDSVQSSLRHQFGLGPEPPGMPAAERGIAQMMLDLYEHFAAPLNDAVLHGWNEMVLAGGRSVQLAGAYRTHADAMQVVSGPVHRRTVHVEAPPSEAVPAEMRRFIGWFKGGLSAENYITITGTSRATATRDLRDLVEKGALTRTGELRHTHYALKLDLD